MKSEDKKIWTDALRSGEYKQGRRNLYFDGKFCCLGVAYVVLVDGDWVFDDKFDSWAVTENPYCNDSDIVLPYEILEKIGLQPYKQDELATFNDDGWSFEQIADWIDENL